MDKSAPVAGLFSSFLLLLMALYVFHRRIFSFSPVRTTLHIYICTCAPSPTPDQPLPLWKVGGMCVVWWWVCVGVVAAGGVVSPI